MSFAMWAYRATRLWWRGSSLDESNVTDHDLRVQEVVKQIAAWDADGRQKRMRTPPSMGAHML